MRKLGTGSGPTENTSAVRIVFRPRNDVGKVYRTVRTAASIAGSMSSGTIGSAASGSRLT